MVIRDKVRQEIDRMPEGVVVSASDFDIPRQYRATLIKALNQFEYAGIIKRISKGRYYKPWKSHSTLTLLATQDLPTFLYYMIDPLKSWCWGAILFYPFKNSRFS